MFVCVCACVIRVFKFGLIKHLQSGCVFAVGKAPQRPACAVKHYESVSPDKQKVSFGRMSQVLSHAAFTPATEGVISHGAEQEEVAMTFTHGGSLPAVQENPGSFDLHFLRDEIRLDIICLIYLLFFSTSS